MLIPSLKKVHSGRGTGRDCSVSEFDSRSVPSRPYKIRFLSDAFPQKTLSFSLFERYCGSSRAVLAHRHMPLLPRLRQPLLHSSHQPGLLTTYISLIG